MADAISVDAPVDDKTINFSTGKLAGQADGAVTVQLGDTVVLVTATASKSAREGADFFPLTVDIEERMYAAGKIPGSFFRREGKAPDQAILTCRLIDRPLRPCFPDGFRNEVHVVGTTLAADLVNPHDVVAINGASAALMLSGIPFDGPIGAVRLAYTADGTWIPFPTYEEGEESTFEMVVAGRALDDGGVAISMVEAGGTEASWPAFEDGAPKVDEAVVADGLQTAERYIKASIDAQRQLMAEAGVKDPMPYNVASDYTDEVYAAVDEQRDRIVATQEISDKAERQAAEGALRDEIVAELGPRFAEVDGAEKQIKAAFRSVTKAVVRSRIVNEGVRIDGRGPKDIRPLSAEVGVLPSVHGSGLFQRGETQVLNVATLGMPRMEQFIDALGTVDRKRYMHHYNFPPYSTGETGFMRGPKRREIGHGILAERALVPVLPTPEEFAYTIRTVSDVLSSNGSTSMASVCGSSLSMMDAGVPLRAAVAGIAMGLVYADGKYTTLTDILGAEDAFGDMDFKVAGTSEFVTALQLDTKIDGIPADVLAQALQQAKEARLEILAVMNATLAEGRDEVGATAPKIISFEIPMDKIGEVIGPKGKVINAIQQETGADISVDDDGSVGRVSIGSTDNGAVAEAERQIRLILNPPTADVGQTYTGRVVNVTKFGAFVNILPGRDGLLHISKIGGGKRIDKVEDVLDLGDTVEVKVDDVDPNGKVSLSLATPIEGGESGGGAAEASDAGGAPAPAESAPADSGAEREYVSFEDSFDDEVRSELGDLGPDTAEERRNSGGGGGGRGRRGGGGGGRRR
ncbi:polyribonucleotide nucleotidyltransferase [Rhabdothermincola salaria]|uniref:polyribonucleotide nucleotidyltransferase n=1 Tax=Rhabdothermincola salaria TaxID=2903142 RepID=UPI001E288943|nr:polyribonucleotide nucleotidyltransferase [Rhabdothermincola salaria]MCD9624911.1 polyribonucleotide nucleotidyltransferase [Rhabdothermincola salaria]